MTSNALSVVKPSDGLSLAPDQDWWTEKQDAALRQIGVSTNATNGDKAVFLHVCQKTGLDPFARQIYMIERQGKQTIQTGIDGFRLIARRAVDKNREALSIGESFWCGEDGVWSDVWLSDQPPAAAKVIVTRGGGTFPGVAIYREYVQTNRDGGPAAQWKQRPAGQLAKCAEALALRKAFPQDLSGVYVDAEMDHADARPITATVEGPKTGAERMRAIVAPKTEGAGEAAESASPADDPAPSDPWDGDEPPMTDRQRKRIFALFGDMGVTDEQLQRDYMSNVLNRTVKSRGELTMVEADQVAEAQRMDLLPDGRPS